MKKKLFKSIFAFCTLLLLIVSCRQDIMLQEEEKYNASTSKFKVVQLKDIPHVTKFIKNKTGRTDLKIQVKSKFKNSSLAKGNINFANLESSFILKKTEDEDVAYYIFDLVNTGDEKTIYNFEAKEVRGIIVDAKVLEYESDVEYGEKPENVFQNFSGKVTAYGLDEKVIGITAFIGGEGP
ncbi:hypothetical protein [Frigoriflavimonas asaccharolytica]|uniref:Lipoprotein n=1 Tax=Frigoriflavimonas asaccharolytica TaxID=2735899 RepID=A0A8J8GCX1_9FLAO|nr:hypothetical protein [Frigoriflavimonas asaccharolytica]NRS93929.1 hypothetical protein [Frigoriflavimonas asaccharolytica]